MLRAWKTAFPGFPVPDAIDRLVRIRVLADTSLASDLCPSFEFYRHGRAIRIWVDHPDPARRDFGATTRFLVHPLELDEVTGWWVYPDSVVPLLETDAVEDVLALITELDAHGLPASAN